MSAVQHGMSANSCVVESFEAKDLGAPFKVILDNSVKATIDHSTGEIVNYKIPDLPGLLRVVVMTRLLHPRKLSGPDLKFVRKAIGFKQKELAAKIELSVEHLSRCETDVFPMSPASEKLFRIFAFKSALKLHKIEACKEKTDLEDALDRLFDGIKTLPVHDAQKELVLHFYRGRVSNGKGADNDSDGHWDANDLGDKDAA